MLSREVQERIAADYEIEIESVKLLGAGDNGSVFRISCVGNKMPPFCVKAIGINNPSAQTEKEIAEIYYKEDKFDVKTYQDAQYYYVTTSFYAGETLESIINKFRTYTVGERMNLFLKITDEIFRVHKLGILHRDLKAENIIIDEKQRPHVIDFGRSTLVFDSSTGRALSTPHMLSLANTTNSWTSYFFYPFYQLARRWQPQTAPEYTSVISHRYGFFCEAESVGFRSDYWAVANLFARLLPEYKDWTTDIFTVEAEHRTSKYFELINKVREYITDEMVTTLACPLKIEQENEVTEERSVRAATI